MDEIFGFFPPSKNPPSKEPMLLLLKQARAFGTGIILSTQNPVDLDYKGLSNIGTWFVGKLQTKQDIEKVLDPLSAKSKLSKSEIAKKLATLKGRHFFMKNVHSDETVEFSTRWVLSYLKGPITKDDIKILMHDKKTKKEGELPQTLEKKDTNSSLKQIVNENIKEYFVDTHINATTPFYPYIYASSQVRFYNKKRAIDSVKNIELKLELDITQEQLSWESSLEENLGTFTKKANVNAKYAPLPNIITQANSLRNVQKTLSNYLYNTHKLELFTCASLKLESKLGVTKRDFLVEVEDNLKELQEISLEKLEDKFEVKYERLEDKLTRLEMRLEKEKSDVSSKTSDTLIDVGLALFSAFFSKSSRSTSMRKGASAFKKGRGVIKERNDVKNIESLMQDLEDDMQELHQKFEEEVQKIEDKLDIQNYEITSTFIKPRRSDILIKDIALLWER